MLLWPSRESPEGGTMLRVEFFILKGSRVIVVNGEHFIL